MKTIKHLIITIIINGLLLYVISRYIPEAGLKITSEYNNYIEIYGFLGLMFWITNGIIRKVLNIVTIPLRLITLGLSSIVLNILMFYFFEQFVNYLDVGIKVELGSIVQVLILSTIISLSHLLVKK